MSLTRCVRRGATIELNYGQILKCHDIAVKRRAANDKAKIDSQSGKFSFKGDLEIDLLGLLAELSANLLVGNTLESSGILDTTPRSARLGTDTYDCSGSDTKVTATSVASLWVNEVKSRYPARYYAQMLIVNYYVLRRGHKELCETIEAGDLDPDAVCQVRFMGAVHHEVMFLHEHYTPKFVWSRETGHHVPMMRFNKETRTQEHVHFYEAPEALYEDLVIRPAAVVACEIADAEAEETAWRTKLLEAEAAAAAAGATSSRP